MAIYQCLYNTYNIYIKNCLKNEEALAQLIISLKEENKKNPQPPQMLSSYRGNNLYWHFTLCVL